MPHLLVVTDPEESPLTIVYRERVALTDFDSAHFTGQLAERVGWAVSDADRLERHRVPALPSPSRPAVRPAA